MRQGYPLSSTLFFLAMNCLSHVLNMAASNGLFGYHHKCEDAKLTHLCFSDDLLIFTEDSLASLKSILEVLRDFEHKSGLVLNIDKTFCLQLGYQRLKLTKS